MHRPVFLARNVLAGLAAAGAAWPLGPFNVLEREDKPGLVQCLTKQTKVPVAIFRSPL